MSGVVQEKQQLLKIFLQFRIALGRLGRPPNMFKRTMLIRAIPLDFLSQFTHRVTLVVQLSQPIIRQATIKILLPKRLILTTHLKF